MGDNNTSVEPVDGRFESHSAKALKILFCTPFFKVPADFGAAIRNFELLKHLTAKHQVTLITYGEDETGQTDAWVTGRGGRVVRLRNSGPYLNDKSRLSTLRNLFYYPPTCFQHFSPRELSAAITCSLEEDGDIDVVVFDTQLAGQAVLEKQIDRPHVMVLLDIYQELQRRRFETTGWRPHKLVRLVDWIKTGYYETRIFTQYQNLITVSSADELLLREQCPRARVFLVPNGVDTATFARNGQPRDPHTILFVGAFEYGPNVDAFFYFCREILPLVQAKYPEVRFIAVGRNPSGEMRDYAAANDGITLTERLKMYAPIMEGLHWL
jgi:glycosyltransferase involved in cell wall biosynthesis